MDDVAIQMLSMALGRAPGQVITKCADSLVVDASVGLETTPGRCELKLGKIQSYKLLWLSINLKQKRFIFYHCYCFTNMKQIVSTKQSEQLSSNQI